MALGDRLEVSKAQGMNIEEGTVVSSDCGDHYWYRGGHWEKLQDDGTYAECEEPKPKATYKVQYLGKDAGFAYDEKSKKWKDRATVVAEYFAAHGEDPLAIRDTKEI